VQIKVSGKNIDIGESLRGYSDKKVERIIEKYIGEKIDANITISKDRKLFDVESCVHLHKGFVIKSHGSSDDPYKAVDMSIERLEEMIKRHKNKIKDKERRNKWNALDPVNATSYILERKESPAETDDEEHLIIAESEKCVLTLSVSEAVMKLDLTGSPVVMFKNTDSGRVNIVYKRPDGHISWLDYKE
jgi:ribosomal subunit interface protein